jgi:hypothetical protein
MSALSSLYVVIFILKLLQQSECSMQAVYRKRKGKYLANHVVRSIKAQFEQECATHCFRDSVCASVNYKISGVGRGLCELNDKTLDEKSNEATHDLEFNHLDIVKRVRFLSQIKAQLHVHSTEISGYRKKEYHKLFITNDCNI